MSELGLWNGLLGSRCRVAFTIGITGLAAIAADCQSADAGWWSLPLSRKSADDAGSKSNSGFSGSIRKLLKEAKAQEEQGNLDKAIALADRAAKMSESTSAFVKPAPDVSPSATARYARDLRLRKVEKSVARKDGTESEGKVAQKDRSDSKSNSNAKKSTTATPKNTVAARRAEPADAPKSKDATLTAAVAAEPRKAKPSPAKASDEFLSRGKESIEIPVEKPEMAAAQPKKIAAAAVTSESDWDEDDPFGVQNAPPPSVIPNVVADGLESERPLVAEQTDKPVPAAATVSINGSVKASGSIVPATLKLRREYSAKVFDETIAVVQVEESTLTGETTEMDASANRSETFDTEESSIIPVAAEQDATFDWDLSKESDDNSSQSDNQEDAFRTKLDTISSEALSTDEVDALRNRLHSAALLEPGVVAPEVIMTSSVSESTWDPAGESLVKTIRPFKLRKKRQSLREQTKPEAKPASVSSVRQPVIGQASVAQWRPVKDSASVVISETKKGTEHRTVRQSDDLRTALRDISMMSFETSANASKNGSQSSRNMTSANRQKNGEWNWDGAAVPSIDSSTTRSPSLAPLPPPDNDFEQTSYRPGESSHRRPLSGSGNQTPSSDSRDDDFLHALDQSIAAEETVDAPPKPRNPPTTGIAKALGISESSFLWTLLSGAGFVALICGLWVVRSTVQPDNASNNR